jgi:hypothetical protein
MTTRPGPAPERGGSPVALDGLRRKGGLKKARASSVIADMTRAEEAAPQASIQFAPERAESQYDNPPSPAFVQEIQPRAGSHSISGRPGTTGPCRSGSCSHSCSCTCL